MLRSQHHTYRTTGAAATPTLLRMQQLALTGPVSAPYPVPMSTTTHIVSVAGYLPEIEVPNEVLRSQLRQPEFVERVAGKSGITTRWAAPEGWATSDLARPAAERAMALAGVSPGDIDLVVLGTDTPDFVTPSTSVVLAHKLGISGIPTFDVGCACASFPTALGAAHGIMASTPGFDRALVVGAYMMRRLGDPGDNAFFFYGDGAGAVVLERGDTGAGPGSAPTGFVAFAGQSDGSYAERWGIFAGGTREPATEEAVREGRTTCRMVDAYPATVNNEGWPKLVRELARRGGFQVDDVDLFLFTQVRKRSIHRAMDALGQRRDKAHYIMHWAGYTGSACLPMALADAAAQGRVRAGDLVIVVGSGVGYHQAAAAYRFAEPPAAASFRPNRSTGSYPDAPVSTGDTASVFSATPR